MAKKTSEHLPVGESWMSGRIGIILATFNPNLIYFREQLLSLAEQTDKNWFCVINDDSSELTCLAAINELAASILRDTSRYVVRRNSGRSGVVGNFGNGLLALPKNCTLFCFSDQDDVWHREKLSKLRAQFHNIGVALVHSDLTLIDDRGREIHPSCWRYEHRDIEGKDTASLILRNNVTGCTMMFSREVLDFCLPFPEVDRLDPQFYHDAWVALGANVVGTTVALPEQLVLYRQHAGNVVGASGAMRNRKGIFKRLFSVEKLLAAWKTRAYLENMFNMRLAERGKQGLETARIHSVSKFGLSRDFGLRVTVKGMQMAIRVPASLRATLQVAVGKFIFDVQRLLKKHGSEPSNRESVS